MGKSLRIKCLIIALVFLLIAVGGVVGAFYGGKYIALSAISQGSGTEDDPYRIYSSNQLNNLQELASSGRCESYTKGKYFKLCNDVKLNVSHKNQSSMFGFFGVLDGDGHTISSGTNCLFDRVDADCVIKNVNFKVGGTVKIKVNYYYYFAVVTTYAAKGATIENCHIYGDLKLDFADCKGTNPFTMTDVYFGGFCSSGTCTIKKCSYNGNISSDTAGVTMRVRFSGINNGKGKNSDCEFNGNIDLKPNGYMQYIGGITYSGSAENCTFNGNINLKPYTEDKRKSYAGKATRIYGIAPTAQNCTFNGDITNQHTIKFASCIIADEESTFTHNGTMPN